MKSKAYETALQTCALCPKMCAYRCPSLQADPLETHHHTGLSMLLLQGTEQAERELFQCSGCRLCQTVCDLHVPVLDVLLEARERLWTSGRQNAAMLRAADRMRERGFPFEVLPASDVPPPKSENPPLSGEIVLRDCVLQQACQPGTAGAGELPSVCCGYVLEAAGAADAFTAHARQTASRLAGAERIYCTSAECLHTLRERYPQAGAELFAKILPLTAKAGFPAVEELLPLLSEAARLVLHVSCASAAAKTGGWREKIREAAGLPSRGAEKLADYEELSVLPACCGGGAFCAVADPVFAAKVTRSFLSPLGEGDVLVTDCSYLLLAAGLPGETKVRIVHAASLAP